MQATGKVDEAVLAEAVRRIVDAAAPWRVILFGSAARSQMHRRSDIDLLVVKEGPIDRELEKRISRALRGLPVPVDTVLVNPRDLDELKDAVASVIRPALLEGRVVYDRGGPPLGIAEEPRDYEVPPVDDPQEWLGKAEDYLAAARRPPPETTRFNVQCENAQTAAEFAVKAVFVKRRLVFPYVHQLETLLDALREGGLLLPDEVWAAEELDAYAGDKRYPDRHRLRPPVLEPAWRRAAAHAQAAVVWARQVVGPAA